MVREDDWVLEIGCGTGMLAVLMARRGASVTGVDDSPGMLAEARDKVTAAELDDRVTLLELEASVLADHLRPGSFDVIVSTLAFSELFDDERRQVIFHDGERCVACGACVLQCPEYAIELKIGNE
jgi:cyclopropane fatty-acyl-phospholipid synthase-like methyltransferase